MSDSRLLDLAKCLVSTNSENPPGYERDVAMVLIEHLEAEGLPSKIIGPSDRPNLIFSTSEEFEVGPLVMHGHMDTVPAGDVSKWKFDPFDAHVENGRLYGRGACDMKGPLAALAETMILYSQEKHDTPLLLLCTSDEESGCSGAEVVADSGILSGVQYGVCAEPTGLNILVGEKGMLWTKIVAEGKAAHGSRPDEGVNAILLCMDALSAIISKTYSFEPNELLGEMTINVGMIEGGIKINVVPDRCEASLDMRTVSGQTIEGILEEMQAAIKACGFENNVSVEYIHGKPAVLTPTNSPIVIATQEIVSSIIGHTSALGTATYGTDCSVLQPRIGISNVICGPGSIEQAHQPNEFISVDELVTSVTIYLHLARRMCDSSSLEKD